MVFIPFLCLWIFHVAANAAPSNTTFEYDYIIVGGGTAGCVLANRLSADSSVSVAVIEAGPTVFNDTRVSDASVFGLTWGSDLDWNYTTTPQIYANNMSLPYHAGRNLGGTSTINGMIYLRPTAEEVDLWSALGNPGLTWDGLLPYFKKSEQLQIPTTAQVIQGASYDPDVHGFIGPVKTGWSKILDTTGFGRALNSSWQSLGLPWNADPNTGNNTGLTLFPSARDVALNLRSDAARAYYLPVIGRPNLHTFTNTTALNVNLGGYNAWHNGSIVAQGVKIVLPSGKTQVLRSKREVILSAGTYRTPGLLERSGIGNPSVLRNLSISPKVILPGVGAHLQDQWLANFIYDANFTSDELYNRYNAMPFSASVTAAELFGDDLDNVAAQLRANISSYARTLSRASGGAISIQAQEEILQLKADLIFNKGAAIGAVLFQVYGFSTWGTMPLSTGTVHSSSNLASPNLNPNFLQLPWDILVQERLSTLMRKLYATPELQASLGLSASTEVVPGTVLVPANASLAQWTSWYKQSLIPVWHAVGSAGMRRRDWGGVVDTKFRVYGVKGLRVVDASVIPLEINGNPSSTVYALAEMAAVDILADGGL